MRAKLFRDLFAFLTRRRSVAPAVVKRILTRKVGRRAGEVVSPPQRPATTGDSAAPHSRLATRMATDTPMRAFTYQLCLIGLSPVNPWFFLRTFLLVRSNLVVANLWARFGKRAGDIVIVAPPPLWPCMNFYLYYCRPMIVSKLLSSTALLDILTGFDCSKLNLTKQNDTTKHNLPEPNLTTQPLKKSHMKFTT